MTNVMVRKFVFVISYCYTLKFSIDVQGGPKKLRQIFLAITLVNMDRF